MELKNIDNVRISTARRSHIDAILKDATIGRFRYVDSRCYLCYEEHVRICAKMGVDITDKDKYIYYLCNFSVDESYRGNGIGSKMLRHFINLVEPGSIIILDCYMERFDFYKRNGFKAASYHDEILDRKFATMYYRKGES